MVRGGQYVSVCSSPRLRLETGLEGDRSAPGDWTQHGGQDLENCRHNLPLRERGANRNLTHLTFIHSLK